MHGASLQFTFAVLLDDSIQCNKYSSQSLLALNFLSHLSHQPHQQHAHQSQSYLLHPSFRYYPILFHISPRCVRTQEWHTYCE